MESFNSCEAFMSKLIRKDRPQTMSVNPSRVNSNVGNKSKQSVVSKNPALPVKMKPKQISHPGSKSNTEGSSVPHKESFNDNGAMVEVTVKTSKGRQRSGTPAEKETWGKVLQSQNVEKTSTFNSFDPLRTLHFLAKELQYKLQNDLPEDSNVQLIVQDMQNALKRVPPEIASTINLLQSNDILSLQKTNSAGSVSTRQLNLEVPRPSRDKMMQTINKDDAAIFQKIMEDSTSKLEASCRQMEMLCGRLKSEKDELEEQLQIERDNVKFLKKRVSDLETQSEHLVSVTIKRLEEEKNELQSQVFKLTDIVDSQSVETKQELKNVKHELRQVTVKADQELSRLKHELAISNMEKEKYIAILSVRDRQINEIRSEMTQLQDVVNEQLVDIHNKALSEFPSAQSLAVENMWNIPQLSNGNSEGDHCEAALSVIHPIEEPSVLTLKAKKTSTLIKESSSVDSQDSDEEGKSKQQQQRPHQRRLSSKQSIRDMFAELKKQAFAVTAVASAPVNQPT